MMHWCPSGLVHPWLLLQAEVLVVSLSLPVSVPLLLCMVYIQGPCPFARSSGFTGHLNEFIDNYKIFQRSILALDS